MKLEHVAILTKQLETMKDFYCGWFGVIANKQYQNKNTGLRTYFGQFDSASRLELMQIEGISEIPLINEDKRLRGLTHLAFGVDSVNDVDILAHRMEQAGIKILRGPRKTGDGYYEFETLDPDNNRLEITTVLR